MSVENEEVPALDEVADADLEVGEEVEPEHDVNVDELEEEEPVTDEQLAQEDGDE